MADHATEDAINGSEDPTQEDAVGNQPDFGEKGEAGDEDNNGSGEGDNGDIAVVGFGVFLIFILGLAEFGSGGFLLGGFFAAGFDGV